MNRTDLTLIIVSSIVIALVLGWSARWLFDRLNRVPHGAEEDEQDPLTAAKEAKGNAEAELKRIQLEYASEYNQLKAELEASQSEMISEGAEIAPEPENDAIDEAPKP